MEKYNYINSYKTWFMRQAGRYLPEYMEVRKKYESFVDFCYSTEDVVKVTKQPVERFNLDFGILFSDILIILDALGAKVSFLKNEGPHIEDANNILEENFNEKKLENIYSAIKSLNNNLKVPLIGFIGGPFTVGCYLTQGSKKNDFENTKKILYQNHEMFDKYIKIITKYSIIHLQNQINNGCKIVKIFDSWAGILPYSQYKKYILEPNNEIVSTLKSKNPDVEIICLPKGSGEKYVEFASIVKPDILAIDQFTDINFIKKNISDEICLQGNLDPMLLTLPNDIVLDEVKNLITSFKDRKCRFNVGHGLVPETKIDIVEKDLNLIGEYK